MGLSAVVVLVLIGIASFFFVTERLRADLVALALLLTLGLSGILNTQETFSGFSRSAVITIMAIFVLTAGLAKTGVTQELGRQLVKWSGRSEASVIIVLMTAGAILSLFMNNIAAAAVLLPVSIGVARERKLSPSKLMMPLSFGTLLGGMATLLTTSNILVSSALRDANLPALGLLDFAPVGVPVIIVGIAYMVLIGRRWLPRRAPADWERLMTAGRVRLEDIYGLRERWFHARVRSTSTLAGQTLAETGLGRELGINVIAISDDGRARLAPPPGERVRAGSDLYLEAREEQLQTLQARGLEVMPDPQGIERFESSEVGLFEVVLAPRSRAVGKTVRELHFRDKFGVMVVAIWREGRPRRVGLGDMALQLGDSLLLLGPFARTRVLQSDGDFIVLTAAREEGLRTNKAPLAAGIMAAAIAAAALGWLPTAEAMLGGALAMVLVGALTMDEAYAAIEWRSIFLIAAMLPVGLALTKTGAAAALGNMLVSGLGGAQPLAIVGGLLVLATVVTQVMSGPAAAVILAPIAIQAAAQVHGNPRLFALAVAYGCSLAFASPLGHPANVLVMGPGGYKFADYVRVGTLLTVILIPLILILLTMVWSV